MQYSYYSYFNYIISTTLLIYFLFSTIHQIYYCISYNIPIFTLLYKPTIKYFYLCGKKYVNSLNNTIS